MTAFPHKNQRGAVLLVALVMLLVITLMAVSNMRSVTLESRITANRAHDMQLKSLADAALREAEFRFYGPGNLSDKLEPKAANCDEDNELVVSGNNKPCLLAVEPDSLLDFVNTPYILGTDNKSTVLQEVSSSGLAWMPYRGLDPLDTTVASDTYSIEWNSILAVETSNSAVNAEYGMVAEGQGTYFYLNNGKAGNNLTLQSTNANIYLGLNN
ncbi:MAG: PilX N-terminal domain-containing pilus assembly protein [Pseudomonas sp.]|uniref:PilX N-terminal domain-containing pilus assembly protein n=1 Tax=Pseudomonas sp. TaxID=306 RepID=UPI003D11FA51